MTNPVLIFIRHAQSQPDPARSPRDWSLTEQGRARCADLADWLSRWQPTRLFTSTEPKAIQTADLIAAHLSIPTRTADGLNETDYGDVPFYPDRADFLAHVQRGFDQPDQVVFGAESFNHAADRFAAAVSALIDEHPDQSLGFVTHGRVLATYLSRHTREPAHAIWERLTMPAAIVCALPDLSPIDQYLLSNPAS